MRVASSTVLRIISKVSIRQRSGPHAHRNIDGTALAIAAKTPAAVRYRLIMEAVEAPYILAKGATFTRLKPRPSDSPGAGIQEISNFTAPALASQTVGRCAAEGGRSAATCQPAGSCSLRFPTPTSVWPDNGERGGEMSATSGWNLDGTAN
jgi:hypothetical protein